MNNIKAFFLSFLLILVLISCSEISPNTVTSYIKTHTLDNVEVCHGYGCKLQTSVSISKFDWKILTEIFKNQNSSAEEERENIKTYIANFENLVGSIADLSNDEAKAKLISVDRGQLDCIDETVNTSNYLNLLQSEGLLKFHKVSEPITRGLFVNGHWFHNTATIIEIDNKNKFAVDSWFHKNGKKPEIIEIDSWQRYWEPESKI